MLALAEPMPVNNLRIAFAVVALAAWAASVAVSLVSHVPVDPWVHLITAAIATALFGPEIWDRTGGRK